MSFNPVAAVRHLHDQRLLYEPVLLIGPGAVEAAVVLAVDGVDVRVGVDSTADRKAARARKMKVVSFQANAPRVPKDVATIIDLGVTAPRKKLLRACLDQLPAAGTVFVVGERKRPAVITPAMIEKATDRKKDVVHPAINFDGGVIIPVQSLTRTVSKKELAVGTKPVPKLATSRPSRLGFAAATPGQQLVKRSHLINPTPNVALQKCHSWCWAAGLQMLCKSQGFNVDQEVFVKKIYGVNSAGNPPCKMSGPWANIKKAIDGTVGQVNGQTITLTSDVIEGIPSTAATIRPMVTDLEAGRPFLFGYAAHIFVCHGATWVERQDRTGPIQITRLELIDPFPTNQRFNWVTFPANHQILSQIMGFLFLNVT